MNRMRVPAFPWRPSRRKSSLLKAALLLWRFSGRNRRKWLVVRAAGDAAQLRVAPAGQDIQRTKITRPCVRRISNDISLPCTSCWQGDSMLRALLFGVGASLALTLAAGGAEAKAPCKDSKGRVVPCPQKSQP